MVSCKKNEIISLFPNKIVLMRITNKRACIFFHFAGINVAIVL